MTSPLRLFRTLLKSAVRSLAFLPLPMMMGGILLGFLLFYFETNTDVSRELTAKFPSVVVSSQATARNVLGIFIAGLMTLMVFTFTQMMSLFNQVANSYSPRLLPLFTSDRSLQFTIGFYIGTIVLNLIVLLSIRSDDEGYIPNISVLISALFGVVSLMLFIYFVSTISSKIQANNIINKVYDKGLYYLKVEVDRDQFSDRSPVPDTADWYRITSPIDGYLGVVDHRRLSELARKHGTRFFIGSLKGEFIPKSFPIIQSERALPEDAVDEVLAAVSPIRIQYYDWYKPQLQLLVEIAQKAMSPGINDPGTATSAIDRINGLLGHIMYIPNYNFMQSEDGGGEVWLATSSFETTLQETYSRLRNYSREDAQVTTALLRMTYQLMDASGNSDGLRALLQEEALAIVNDANRYFRNPHDRRILAAHVARWRKESKTSLKHREVLNRDESATQGVPLR